jgi:hypothetical protein
MMNMQLAAYSLVDMLILIIKDLMVETFITKDANDKRNYSITFCFSWINDRVSNTNRCVYDLHKHKEMFGFFF